MTNSGEVLDLGDELEVHFRVSKEALGELPSFSRLLESDPARAREILAGFLPANLELIEAYVEEGYREGVYK